MEVEEDLDATQEHMNVVMRKLDKLIDTKGAFSVAGSSVKKKACAVSIQLSTVQRRAFVHTFYAFSNLTLFLPQVMKRRQSLALEHVVSVTSQIQYNYIRFFVMGFDADRSFHLGVIHN